MREYTVVLYKIRGIVFLSLLMNFSVRNLLHRVSCLFVCLFVCLLVVTVMFR